MGEPLTFLIVLLLPGVLFCAIMTGEILLNGNKPELIFLDKSLSLPIIYLIVLVGGWLLVILWFCVAIFGIRTKQ